MIWIAFLFRKKCNPKCHACRLWTQSVRTVHSLWWDSHLMVLRKTKIDIYVLLLTETEKWEASVFKEMHHSRKWEVIENCILFVFQDHCHHLLLNPEYSWFLLISWGKAFSVRTILENFQWSCIFVTMQCHQRGWTLLDTKQFISGWPQLQGWGQLRAGVKLDLNIHSEHCIEIHDPEWRQIY